MCEAWPGPRCSHDMGKKVDLRTKSLLEVATKSGKESPEYNTALARLIFAQEEYNSTPKGIKELKEIAEENPTAENITALNKAELVRQLQTEAIREIQNGRSSAVTNLSSYNEKFLDADEISSITEAAREYYEKFAIRNPDVKQVPVSQKVYDKYVDGIEARLTQTYPEGIPSSLQEDLTLLRSLTPPNQATLKSYEYLPKALERSKTVLDRELRKASALQSVNKEVAQAYYEAYREQYKKEYASLPDSERPDPPESWIRGELSQSGYTQDPNSTFAPRDKASLYAMYRLRSDEDATPDFLKNSRAIASIDLETAGPVGRDGFEPQNGRIIEVGIVSYNSKGKELNRYSQLIKPEQAFLDSNGTGAEHIHQISAEDIKNSPSWNNVQGKVSQNLEGKILLAQNANFEYRWLNYHLNGFSKDKTTPIIDTLDMSRKHLDLQNHQLATICGAVGVKYTEGHRATHDALVTGEAYFALKRYIKKTWNSKPARKNAKQLKTIPFGSRWDSWTKPV